MTKPVAWLTNILWIDLPRYVVTYEGDRSGCENFPVYRHPPSDEELAGALAASERFSVAWRDAERRAERAEAQLAEAIEALEEVEEYLDDRSDADYDDTGFVPNTEMRLLAVVRAALNK